jgi:NADH-quinone oxidoreductase subunit M
MVAYSSISHMGMVLLGIATLNETGITGAVLQMTAHGLIAGALFLLVGLLYERTHTRNIRDYSSLIQVMPRFTLLMTLSLLAAIGLPGTVGFIAELHTLIGGFSAFSNHDLGMVVMLCFSLSILVGAAYAIRTISLLFTGPVKQEMQHLKDLNTPELLAAGILVTGIVLFGLSPTAIIDLSTATTSQMNSIISQRIL